MYGSSPNMTVDNIFYPTHPTPITTNFHPHSASSSSTLPFHSIPCLPLYSSLYSLPPIQPFSTPIPSPSTVLNRLDKISQTILNIAILPWKSTFHHYIKKRLQPWRQSGILNLQSGNPAVVSRKHLIMNIPPQRGVGDISLWTNKPDCMMTVV